MNIKQKLYLITLLSILGFVISASLIVLGFNQIQNIRMIERSALQVSMQWKTLGIAYKDVMIRAEPLNDLIEIADTNLSTFRHELELFLEYKDDPLLDAEQQEQMVSLETLWFMSESSYFDIIDYLKKLQTLGLDPKITPRGLLRYLGEVSVARELGNNGVFEIQQINDRQRQTTFASESFSSVIAALLDSIQTSSNKLSTTLFISSGAALGVSVILAFLLLGGFNRRLTAKIRSLETVMHGVAEQNLTKKADIFGRDEISSLGSLVNQVVDKLNIFISAVQQTVSTVKSQSANISYDTSESSAALEQISKNIESIKEQLSYMSDSISASNDAAEGIDTTLKDLFDQIMAQTYSIETSLSSINEISSAIVEVSSQTRSNKEKAENLELVVRKGGDELDDMISAVFSIASDVSNIKEIVEIIQSISDQTNLLSMNAAIESAHAGEAGRGFSVVAEEIRNLSNTTAENTKNVSDVLSRMVSRIEEAKVAGERTSGSFGQIKDFVSEFTNSAEEMANAMDEINTGSAAILKETSDLNYAAEEIEKGAETVKLRSAEVSTILKQLTKVSIEIKSGSKEIDDGAKDVLKSMLRISENSQEASDRVIELKSLVDEFDLSEE